MDYSMPVFPVLHCVLEFTQTHVHWVNDAIQPPSSSVTPFSSCPQSFPVSGSFPMSWFVTSGGQSIEVLTSASVLTMNIQGWFLLVMTGLISLLSKGLSRVFSSTTLWKHQFFSAKPSLWSNSHILTWLTIALAIGTFVDKVMCLLLNILCVSAFLSRSKYLLISWLQSLSPVILESKKIKSVTIYIVSPSICHEVSDGTRYHDLSFLNVEF